MARGFLCQNKSNFPNNLYHILGLTFGRKVGQNKVSGSGATALSLQKNFNIHIQRFLHIAKFLGLYTKSKLFIGWFSMPIFDTENMEKTDNQQ